MDSSTDKNGFQHQQPNATTHSTTFRSSTSLFFFSLFVIFNCIVAEEKKGVEKKSWTYVVEKKLKIVEFILWVVKDNRLEDIQFQFILFQTLIRCKML